MLTFENPNESETRAALRTDTAAMLNTLGGNSAEMSADRAWTFHAACCASDDVYATSRVAHVYGPAMRDANGVESVPVWRTMVGLASHRLTRVPSEFDAKRLVRQPGDRCITRFVRSAVRVNVYGAPRVDRDGVESVPVSVGVLCYARPDTPAHGRVVVTHGRFASRKPETMRRYVRDRARIVFDALTLADADAGTLNAARWNGHALAAPRRDRLTDALARRSHGHRTGSLRHLGDAMVSARHDGNALACTVLAACRWAGTWSIIAPMHAKRLSRAQRKSPPCAQLADTMRDARMPDVLVAWCERLPAAVVADVLRPYVRGIPGGSDDESEADAVSMIGAGNATDVSARRAHDADMLRVFEEWARHAGV